MTLPPNLPEDLRAFLECTGDAATIANGPVDLGRDPAGARGLLGGAAHPELQVTPGSSPGPRPARQGRLGRRRRSRRRSSTGGSSIDTLEAADAGPGIGQGTEIQRFVETLNGSARRERQGPRRADVRRRRA